MNINKDIATKVKKGIAILMIGGMVSFADSMQQNKFCKEVMIDIQNGGQYKFVDQQTVKDILTERGRESFLEKKMGDIDLKYLEKKLKKDQFVKEAQVFKGLDGIVMVKVIQPVPIARVIKGFKSFYIDKEGNTFSSTRRFTAKVPIVTVDERSSLFSRDSLLLTEEQEIYKLLSYVSEHEFFSKQLVQFDIDKNGEIQLFPQITKQVVSFGDVSNYEEKLKRLLIFYKRVLPVKGWNAYARVNIQYKDQIICE